jgi:hypothetical protein
MQASTLLREYLEGAGDIEIAKQVRTSYASARNKDVSIQLAIQILIDGVPVPPTDAGVAARFVGRQVRAQFIPLLTSAIAAAESELGAKRGAARAELDRVIPPA